MLYLIKKTIQALLKATSLHYLFSRQFKAKPYCTCSRRGRVQNPLKQQPKHNSKQPSFGSSCKSIVSPDRVAKQKFDSKKCCKGAKARRVGEG